MTDVVGRGRKDAHMRLAITAIAALLLLVTSPTDAPALKLGRVFGKITGPVSSLLRRGGQRALRPYAYRPRAYAKRRAVSARAAVAAVAPAQQGQAQRGQTPPRPISQGQIVRPEPFWPAASQDLFDYIMWPKAPGLWAHGYGVLVASMFAQPPKTAGTRGNRLAASDSAEQTASVAPTGGEPICDRHGTGRADAITRQLRDTLALADDERGALAELHSALLKADEDITAACPQEMPVAMPDRLREMQDRLWAMRVAVTNLRAPLQAFHDSLTSEQKAKLDAQQPSEGDSKRDASAGTAARLCQAQTQRAPHWPADQIARAVRANRVQQASLEALSQTSSQMGLMMAGSCPQKVPATPLARLNAALDWIDTVLFAATNMVVVVDDFYQSLNDGQKSKLNTLSQ